MDSEFHYYITNFIALSAGFSKEDAHIIAYASQYTDDNTTPFTIEDIYNGGTFSSYISQTSDITKPQEDRLSVYPFFHFCPGAPKEAEAYCKKLFFDKLNYLVTIPDNCYARIIFQEALKTQNLYRIGIATHMYADTFCHRDFTGWKDPFNDEVDRFLSIETWALPYIGHAQAGHNPDIPTNMWTDARQFGFNVDKNNNESILEAAGNIFDFYCECGMIMGAVKETRESLIKKIQAAMGNATRKNTSAKKGEREDRYKNLIDSDLIPYDEKDWFMDAVDCARNENIPVSSFNSDENPWPCKWKTRDDNDKRIDYKDTHWYKFQIAVKDQHACALEYLENAFIAAKIPIREIHDSPLSDDYIDDSRKKFFSS
jgi:hypothetical protein